MPQLNKNRNEEETIPMTFAGRTGMGIGSDWVGGKVGWDELSLGFRDEKVPAMCLVF